jgi:hypothetical protein
MASAPQPAASPAPAPTPPAIVVNPSLRPTEGAWVFDNEGNEGGPWASRKLQVPDDNSGLTLGRGYDMGSRDETQIFNELKGAGVAEADAKTLSQAAKKRGKAARDFIKDNKLQNFEIGSDVQVALFNLCYGQEKSAVAKIGKKKDTVAAYGELDLDKLDPTLKELVIDLKFRGDYDGDSRKLLQKALVDNDVRKVRDVMVNSDNWPNVPTERFKARKAFMDDAVKKLPPPPAKPPVTLKKP